MGGLREHAAVEHRPLEQLLVGALLDRAPVIEQHHAVGERDRGRTVGDDDRRPTRHHLAQRGADLVLLRGVHRRRGVVEDQHARVGEHRARDGDALTLAARERVAVLADHRLVPVGQRLDEVGRARERGGAAHLVEVRLGVGERDVLAHAVAEQERVLEHDADRAANVAEVEVAHVDAVEQHASLVDVVEARDQPGDRGLPARGGTDQRDRLARPQHEVEALEHRSARRRTGSRPPRTAARPSPRRGSGVPRGGSVISGIGRQHLEDASRGTGRARRLRDQLAGEAERAGSASRCRG